ncbi:MAG: hypothetical protein ABI718_01170 [Acidobacteriota bacterium]
MKLFAAFLVLSMTAGCAAEKNPPVAQTDVAQPSTSSSPTVAPTRNEKVTAIPDPVPVCDGSGRGITTISWVGDRDSIYEIRLGGPQGKLFAAGRGPGTAKTDKWVTNGMEFTLVMKGGATALDSIKVATTSEGCE